LRNSFDSDDDMILRRTEEGAEKWCLRDLRREEETSMEVENQHPHPVKPGIKTTSEAQTVNPPHLSSIKRI
jgi:hypothetical protein